MSKYDINITCRCGAALLLTQGASVNELTETRHALDEFQKSHRACLEKNPPGQWKPLASHPDNSEILEAGTEIHDVEPDLFVTANTLLDIAADMRVQAKLIGPEMRTARHLLELIATSIEQTIKESEETRLEQTVRELSSER